MQRNNRLNWIEACLRKHKTADLKELAYQVCNDFNCCLKIAREDIRQLKWKIDNG